MPKSELSQEHVKHIDKNYLISKANYLQICFGHQRLVFSN